MLVLGAAYVGEMDDLAVFNRALGDEEVKVLYGLTGGAGGIEGVRRRVLGLRFFSGMGSPRSGRRDVATQVAS